MEVQNPSFAELVNYDPNQLFSMSSTGEVHGTTVLALRYKNGIVMLSDRRATIGNLIMYDQANKIIPLDDQTVIAISGSFAKAMKVARYLKHAFKFYRRVHLIDMSIDGKVQEISESVAGNVKRDDNLGVFIPILGCYNPDTDEFLIYFFDGAGAYFTHDAYACAGSGSERIKGIFEYLTQTKAAWTKRELKDVLIDGLRMLDIAAELDAATGGFERVPPIVRILDRNGNREVTEKMLQECIKEVLKTQKLARTRKNLNG